MGRGRLLAPVGGRAVDGPLAGTGLAPVTAMESLWFDWAAFHPDTVIWGGLTAMARLRTRAVVAIAGTLAGVRLAAGNYPPWVLSAFLMWRASSYLPKLAARVMVGAPPPLAGFGSRIRCHQPVSVADRAAIGRELPV